MSQESGKKDAVHYSSSGCGGCLGLFVWIILIWILIGGISIGSNHYEFGCDRKHSSFQIRKVE